MLRQTRMPGLLVHGASGIGKTMIARNLSRRYAPEYDPESGITRTPLLLLQAPPAPDARRLYMHILAAVGAPSSALSLRAQSVASLEARVVGLLRDLGLRMIMIDEVHNLLAVSYDLDLPLIRTWIAANGLSLDGRRPVVSVPDLRVLRSLVLSGAGWTVLPDYLCQSDIEADRRAEIPAPAERPGNGLRLVWAKGALRHPRIAYARDLLLVALDTPRLKSAGTV